MPVKPEISSAEKKIIHGVFVITTSLKGRVNGMTAAWVGRASFNPPLITASIGKTRFSHDMIKESGVFAINVLGPDNIAAGKRFGLKSGRKTDKFVGVEYETKATGSPILKECIAWMDCKVVSCVDAGDHTLFIGEVLDAWVSKDETPLVYVKEDFFR
ncbi:MAG: flavin reductase [Deltaproteobacteria bacterium]|nr:flavin reductase [Deltaproteobacteria bacterium]